MCLFSKRSWKLISILALVMLMTNVATPVQAQPGKDKGELTQDVNGTQALVCDGVSRDVVQIQGSYTIRYNVLYDDQRLQIHLHMTDVNLSVQSIITGELYKVHEVSHSSENRTQGAWTFTQIIHFRLSAPSGLTYRETYKGHFTVNANGEMTNGSSEWSYECK
jgi:hypothetical protein